MIAKPTRALMGVSMRCSEPGPRAPVAIHASRGPGRWVVRRRDDMKGLILIGLIVLAIGKLKLTPTITLQGVRARWYGLTLVVTAFPFQWLMQHLFPLVLPSQILQDRIWLMV